MQAFDMYFPIAFSVNANKFSCKSHRILKMEKNAELLFKCGPGADKRKA